VELILHFGKFLLALAHELLKMSDWLISERTRLEAALAIDGLFFLAHMLKLPLQLREFVFLSHKSFVLTVKFKQTLHLRLLVIHFLYLRVVAEQRPPVVAGDVRAVLFIGLLLPPIQQLFLL